MKQLFAIHRSVSLVSVSEAALILNRSGGWSAGHQQGPPQGGTPIRAREGAAGRRLGHAQDNELEKSVAVRKTNGMLRATFASRTESVEFQRAPNNAADKKVPAASSLFEAGADWIKTARNFSGAIPTITLKGRTYTNIMFPFPKGTKHTH